MPRWLAPWNAHADRACSLVCLGIISLRKDPMTDPTDLELEALEAASADAGQYLESEGESDLARLTPEQWMALLRVVVGSWTSNLRRIEEAHAIPY